MQESLSSVFPRQSLGLVNPNHTAALICAFMPFFWGWRRCACLGWIVLALLCALLAVTQSRTGIIVLVMQLMFLQLSGRVVSRECKMANAKCRIAGWFALLAAIAVAAWWIWPRLTIDDSILNRPRIWFAGLQLFAANPSGVRLGNSGAVASAFLLPDIPEIRTMISAHVTLLAEFGWLVGLAWFAFISLALLGLRQSPRIGIAFAGLVVSGCSSTIFDWPVLFDMADFGGLGITNWILSWTMFLMFVGMGCWLIWKGVWQFGGEGSRTPARASASRTAFGWGICPAMPAAVAVAAIAVCAALMVPKCNAPTVHDGYVFRGEAPRTLALYDDGWRLRTVLPRVGGAAVLPIHAVSRFPHDFDMSGVGKVMLFGNCREWAHLVKGVPVVCAED